MHDARTELLTQAQLPPLRTAARVVMWMRGEDAGKLPPVAGTWEVLKNVASAI